MSLQKEQNNHMAINTALHIKSAAIQHIPLVLQLAFSELYVFLLLN